MSKERMRIAEPPNRSTAAAIVAVRYWFRARERRIDGYPSEAEWSVN